MTSKIKVDNINKVSDDSNIIKKCGSTVTLGASGDSIALASGATQTGFGRTGTVDWQTGSIKTSDFTASNGEGYFINTTSGEVEATLPSGSAGAIVSIQDYNNTFDSNSAIVNPASGEKINGGAANGSLVLATEGQGVTFVYIDATVGWRSVQDNLYKTTGNDFIVATGGTITTSGNDKIHTFTGPGTFCVSGVAVCAANNLISYAVVAGGGGAGTVKGSGGGAGGYREVKSPSTPYTASPTDGYPSAPNRITVTAQGYPITIGAGSAGVPSSAGDGTTACQGSNSIFSSITSAGGGGGNKSPGAGHGNAAGSGGSGAGQSGGNSASGAAGNTPPTTPAQGNPGGAGVNPATAAGGGGGATAAGSSGSTNTGGNGGAGATSCISASPTARAGGGAGSGNSSQGSGGAGGGGAATSTAGPTNAGTVNTGGGGGGVYTSGNGGAGGSGIVIIRYRYQ
jgi:hypothetical protein